MKALITLLFPLSSALASEQADVFVTPAAKAAAAFTRDHPV
jgi:hypothetical protein